MIDLHFINRNEDGQNHAYNIGDSRTQESYISKSNNRR